MMAISFTVAPDAFHRSFAAILGDPDAHLLVIDVDGRVGGYLLGFEHPAFFANGPVAWVEEIAVQGGLRRRNLGSQLMHGFENAMRDRGGRLVALATTRAEAFYEALDYERHAAYYRTIL